MVGLDVPATIIASATLLGVVTTSIISLAAFLRSGNNSQKLEKQAVKIEQIHMTTNSLSERSNTAERAAGRAEGELAGRAAALHELQAAALARERMLVVPVPGATPAAPPTVAVANGSAQTVGEAVKAMAGDVAQETFQAGVDALKDQKTNGGKP